MIINDDCLNAMKQMQDNCIDFVVTDPPYGLSFMGKHWDGKVPSVDVWQEALRVCKPGSMLAAFGGSRTHHHLMLALEQAGWEIRDVVMWLYGSGFPKSHNHFGLEGYGTSLKPAYEPIIICQKPLDGTYKKNVEKWGIGGINIDESRIEGIKPIAKNGSFEAWRRLENRSDIPKFKQTYDANKGRWPANIILDEEAEQILCLINNIPNDIIQVIQEYFHDYKLRDLPKRNKNLSLSRENQQGTILQQEMLLSSVECTPKGRETFHVGQKTQERINREDETTTRQEGMGQSNVQRSLDVTRIPLPEYSSVADRSTDSCEANVEQGWDIRTSLNDGIETRKTPKELGSGSPCEWSKGRQQNGEFGSDGQLNSQERTQRDIERIEGVTKGKRGIEVLSCDIPEKWMKYFEETGYEIRSPYCAAAQLDQQSGVSKTTPDKRSGCGVNDKVYESGFKRMPSFLNDSGGASRFFYCPKASSSERNKGLEGMAIKENMRVNAPRKTEEEKTANKMQNTHPTVKPIALMKYIITLLAPPNNPTLLDPFAGSGSTLVAAAELGINFIGIEKEDEYCEIAKRRVLAVEPLLKVIG